MTHRKGLEEDEALYDALHGVAGETEGAGEMPALLVAERGRGGEAGVHERAAWSRVPRRAQHARQRRALHQPRQWVHARHRRLAEHAHYRRRHHTLTRFIQHYRL